MKKEQIKRRLGARGKPATDADLARVFKVTRQAVHKWGDTIPPKQELFWIKKIVPKLDRIKAKLAA